MPQINNFVYHILIIAVRDKLTCTMVQEQKRKGKYVSLTLVLKAFGDFSDMLD